jgi:probable O-glycosylation ligase (exosortase A-associated)
VPLRGILLLAFITGSLPFCLFNPFYGIIVWTILAFLNPQSFIWGAAGAFQWATAVGLATIAGFLIFSRGWVSRLASIQVTLLAILWIWFLITSLNIDHSPVLMHHSDDTWFRFEFVSKILLMTLVTIGVVDSFSRLRTLVIVIAACFAVFVVKALPFIVLSGGSYRVFGPEHSMIGDNNDFGLAMNMTAPLFFFLAQAETGRWRKFWGCMFIGSIPTILFTYSRGALVGLTVVMFLMLVRLKQRFLIFSVLVVAVVIAFLFAPPAWRERMNPTLEGVVDGSAQERFNAWTFSWRLAADYPLAGGGFETFTPELFERYATNVANVRGPHSIYFGVLAEHGFIGFALYLTLVASCFATTIRLAREARIRGDLVVEHYANMFRFSLIGFLTSGLFLGRAYFDYYFTLVACIVILNRVARRAWMEEASTEGGTELESPAAEMDLAVDPSARALLTWRSAQPARSLLDAGFAVKSQSGFSPPTNQ